jgi:esterase/lipase
MIRQERYSPDHFHMATFCSISILTLLYSIEYVLFQGFSVGDVLAIAAAYHADVKRVFTAGGNHSITARTEGLKEELAEIERNYEDEDKTAVNITKYKDAKLAAKQTYALC